MLILSVRLPVSPLFPFALVVSLIRTSFLARGRKFLLGVRAWKVVSSLTVRSEATLRAHQPLRGLTLACTQATP